MKLKGQLTVYEARTYNGQTCHSNLFLGNVDASDCYFINGTDLTGSSSMMETLRMKLESCEHVRLISFKKW